MSPPLVSVIIPAYNRSDMLRQALRSLSQQTFPDFSVIVCDDASTENLRAVTSEFPQLSIAFHRFERGGSAVINHQRGTDLCASPFALFLHSDDLLLPGALEKMLACLEGRPDAGACVGGMVEFNPAPDGSAHVTKTLLPRPLPQRKHGWLDLSKYTACAPSQVLLRMETFRQVGGFHTGCAIIYDWELLLALSAVRPVLALTDITTGYRHHAGQSITQNGIEAGSLNARDTLFVTGRGNPRRARLGMTPIERLFLRQTIGWELLRESVRSARPWRHLARVVWILWQHGVMIPLVLCAPAWLALRLIRRSVDHGTPTLTEAERAAYGKLLDPLLKA